MEASSCFVSTGSHTEDRLNVEDKLLCNMCDLEPHRDPVVTSCGHLYCWSCLNKCLQNQAQKHCRVCETPLIHDANFVKIYGTDSQVDQSDEAALECRICLDSLPPTNAVATSCGHVFCWPCLYQWLHTHHRPKRSCPVCRNVLVKDVNILPLCGSHKMHSGNHGASNVGTAAEAANSGGFFIPPRPKPPQDALALSSRMYPTSDDELESDNENVHLSSDEESNDDPNDDMSTGDEESADEPELLVINALPLRGLPRERLLRRFLRRAQRREQLQVLRSVES